MLIHFNNKDVASVQLMMFHLIVKIKNIQNGKKYMLTSYNDQMITLKKNDKGTNFLCVFLCEMLIE